jgi:triphosphoribosyl-dephospho-CoA synthase
MNPARLTPGRLAQLACILEVVAPKPGNVHRSRDLPALHLVDFLASATAIGEALDLAATRGVGEAVERAILATRQVVSTNTNLGMVLLLAPLAAVPMEERLDSGVRAVLEATTIADARAVYRAIRLAQPGGLGSVPEQDVAGEPTLSLKAVMSLAADRDLVARQYANGYEEVFRDAFQAMQHAITKGHSAETAVVTAHLTVLSRHLDSLIVRKAGMSSAEQVSRRAADVLGCGWPEDPRAARRCDELDRWLRDPGRRLNPGTTADIVTAALYAALRDGTIPVPITAEPAD